MNHECDVIDTGVINLQFACLDATQVFSDWKLLPSNGWFLACVN